MIDIFYWKTRPNVGDYYSFWLAKKLYKNLDVRWSANPRLVITGSILSWKELTNNTIVWGCGFHNRLPNESCKITNKTNFKAVRGILSAKKLNLNIEKIAIGDPGLLASKYFKPDSIKNKKMCILAHYRDFDKLNSIYGKNIDVIDMGTNDVEGILTKINQYEMVLSSSLHGIIFAHSYGIPAFHIKAELKESKDDFKYKDYYSALSIPYDNYKLKYNLKDDLYKFNDIYKNRSLYKISNDELDLICKKLLDKLPSVKLLEKQFNNVVCAIAKSENLYINDWINWYVKIGFDHIFIADNNSTNTEWIGNYIDNIDNVTIINYNDRKESGLQLKFYNNFYKEHGNQFKWCLFVDIDEYLSGIDNINTFINNSKYNNFDMIRFKWRLFGDDDLVSRDVSIPVYEFFKKEIVNNSLSFQGKSMIRGSLTNICIGSCHFAFNGYRDLNNLKYDDLSSVIPLKECLPSGKETKNKISITDDYTEEKVYLNHYMTKTLSEFINQKLYRGDACFINRKIDLDYYWKINNKTAEKLNYIDKFNANQPKMENIQYNDNDANANLNSVKSKVYISNISVEPFTGLTEEWWREDLL